MAGAGSSALGDQEIQGHIGSRFFNLAQSPAHGKHSKKKKKKKHSHFQSEWKYQVTRILPKGGVKCCFKYHK